MAVQLHGLYVRHDHVQAVAVSFVFPAITSPVKSVRVGSPATYDRVFHSGISLNFASGIHYVKAGLAAPTVAPLTSLFTFTCGNQSMYRGPSGLLIASATNTPRIEYDASGNCLGLLMEGARTNQCLQSQTFGTTWTQTRATVGSNSVVAPDGTTTADTIIEDGTAASDHQVLQSPTFVSGTVYTVSVWAKSANRHWLIMQLGAGAFSGVPTCSFNLSTGVVGTAGGGGTSTISSYGNGWHRCTMTATATASAAAAFRLYVGEGDNDATFSGLSQDSLYLWGAQVEAGAFHSSYIPTTTGSVARTADSCIRTLGSEFSATAGTAVVIVSGFVSSNVSANNCIASFDDATANERLTLQRTNTAGAMRLNVFDGGVNQAAVDGLSAISTAGVRLAYSYAANDYAISGNGGAIATDGAGTLPTVTRLDLGSRLAAEHLFGHIRTFDYWPERKHNAELVRLSSG